MKLMTYKLFFFFYKSQWEVVREAFSNLICGVFEVPARIAKINSTLITLIPKIDTVSNMKHFQPISLCNVTYKTDCH